MYHVIVDILNDDIKQGDIAYLDVNPLYVSEWIRREFI